MNPQVLDFVVAQLLLIIVPVGLLFGFWVWMLNWTADNHQDR